MLLSPLEQFTEKKLLWVLKSSVLIILSLLLLIWINNKIKLKLNKKNVTVISIYDSVVTTTENQSVTKKYLGLTISVTLLILIINLMGNIPYGYANTSSIVVCLGLSMWLWISIFILIVWRYKTKILAFFIPSGTPLVLTPLLVLIEVVSYISRSLSLGVRLFSNIVAGHVLIHLISNFMYVILKKNVIILLLLWLPYIIFLSLIGLELSVSIIQSYVFLLLISSYLHDSIYLH